MGHPRTLRFGVQIANAASADEWAAKARRAEDLGFATLFMPDHFGDQLAPVPALLAAADATTDLRVGALVFDNDYKHPVVLAKELATIDVLSGGRLEIGLGAGWMVEDYEQSGIPYDPPRVRVDRFEEGLRVVKGLMADGPLHLDGEHYTIAGLDGLPKPVQRPHPPVLIGGGGRRMLAIAAREADIVGVNPNLRSGRVDAETAADAVPSRYDEKLAWLRDAAGDRFDDLELNCLMFFVSRTDDREAFAANVAGMFGLPADDALDIPLSLFGTVDQMCDALRARRDRWGFSYICCQEDAMDDLAPVIERLAGT